MMYRSASSKKSNLDSQYTESSNIDKKNPVVKQVVKKIIKAKIKKMVPR